MDGETAERETMKTISVTVYLRIHDEEAFRRAARDEYKSILPPEDADDYLDPEKTSLGDCASILIDPSVSPARSEVLDSAAGEEYEDDL